MPDIYLLRHAESVSHKDTRYSVDAERPLTAAGHDQMKRAAQGMRRLGISFDRILTSPYARAKQTAEIVARELGTGVVVEEAALASGAHWGRVKRALAAHPGCGSVLLVGHQPDLSHIAADLIEARSASLSFGKGTLARIAVDSIPPRETGSLVFLLDVDHLATLAP